MIWVGTSGYNYPEWKGSFYPKELPAAKMLPYYAARFPTVEINYTFYRMPTEKLVGGWAAQTPSPYKLTLKAPRRITHDSRLRNCGPLAGGLLRRRRLARRQARRAAVSAAAQREEGSAAVRRVSGRPSAGRPRRLRIPARLVARRRGVRAAAAPQPRAVRRRQREDVDAGSDHRRLRVLPVARRGLHGGRHRALGRHDRAGNDAIAATCSCISSTKKKAKARSSPGC